MYVKVDKTTAIALVYNGIDDIRRVESFDSAKPMFFFELDQRDLTAVQSEMKGEDLTVYLPAILRSVQAIDSLLQLTRVDGVWVKPKQ